MSDTKNKKTPNKPSSPMVSKWASVSIWSASLGWCGFSIFLLMFLILLFIEDLLGYNTVIFRKVWIGLAICTIISNILAAASGLIALIWIIIKWGKLGGQAKALGGLCLGIVYIALVLTILPAITEARFIGQKTLCRDNLSNIGIAISKYNIEHDRKYPSPDKWCDLFIDDPNNNSEFLRCPTCKQCRSSYAMNPNCEPNSPADMVLLFETKCGWNQHGGAELLTLDNHGGKGSNVLFNDGHIKFVWKEDIGKLKWKAEDGNNVK